MIWRLLSVTGRLCLSLILLCIIFQALFLAVAYAAEKLTEPPACKVSYVFPMPFVVCPGFSRDPVIEFALALPRAILTFPFTLPGLLTDTSSSLQFFVIAPALLHIFAWGYLIVFALGRLLVFRRR